MCLVFRILAAMARVHATWALVALALIIPRRAHAEDPRVGLVVEAPPGCISSQDLGARVDALLARSATGEAGGAAPLVRVVVDRAGDEWHAVLTLIDARSAILGTREITQRGPNCRALNGPLAVVTSLLIEVAKNVVHLSLPPEPAPRPPPEPPPPPSLVPRAVAPPHSWGARGSLLGAAQVGLMPGVAPGARFELRALPPSPLSFGLRAAAYPHAYADVSGSYAGFFEGLVGAVGCYGNRAGVLRLEGCIALDAGFIAASDPLVPGQGSLARVLLASPEVGVAWHVSTSSALNLSLSVPGGLRPTDWHVHQASGATVVLFRPWPVGLVVGLGFSFGS
jgi:hypothetical protein